MRGNLMENEETKNPILGGHPKKMPVMLIKV